MAYDNNGCKGEFDYYISMSCPIRRRASYEAKRYELNFVERM